LLNVKYRSQRSNYLESELFQKHSLNARHRLIAWVMVMLMTVFFSAPSFAIGPHKSPVVRKPPISLEITTHLGDNQQFVKGDTIYFFVSLDHDAYLLIIYETADKKLIQILPNSYNKKNFYRRGDFFQIPDEDRPFNFKVSPPFGHEKIMAFASTRSFPTLKGTTTKSGIRILAGNVKSVLRILRKHGRRHGAYGEATLKLFTSDRK